MQQYEKLGNNLYGAEMYRGKLELKPTHGFSCFFIVEHIADKEFVKNQAMQLLLAGCRNFNFYGNAEPIWHLIVDETDILLYPDSTSESVALTSGWDSIEDFADALDVELSLRTFVPHDIFLIYDDVRIYNDVVACLEELRNNG